MKCYRNFPSYSLLFYSNSSESKNQMLNNLNDKGKVVKSHHKYNTGKN